MTPGVFDVIGSAETSAAPEQRCRQADRRGERGCSDRHRCPSWASSRAGDVAVPTLLPQPWLKAGVVSAGMVFSEASSTSSSPAEQGEESSSSSAGQLPG